MKYLNCFLTKFIMKIDQKDIIQLVKNVCRKIYWPASENCCLKDIGQLVKIVATLIKDDMSICHDVLCNTMTCHSFKDIKIYSLMMSFSTNCSRVIRIPNYNVCIRSYCYTTLKLYISIQCKSVNNNKDQTYRKSKTTCLTFGQAI
jgi:hypothetical protein